MNLRSKIGYLVTAIYDEVHNPWSKTDKYLVKRWQNELQALIDAPSIEFTALPEKPMTCPPTELYEDEWTRSPEWRAEHAFLFSLC